IYLIILFVIIMSWIPIFDIRKEPIATFVKIYMGLTAPFRAIIPPIGGVLDISPILLFLVLGFLHRALLTVFAALHI
ncbi:YggT family protein, partial [bacterium]|nr:YggT family protein [bacterium]